MRRQKLLLGTIFFTICLLFMSFNTALAEETLTVKKGTWTPLHERIHQGLQLDVVNEDYTLEGLTDTYESFYEVPTQGAGNKSEVTLHVTYSELLKKESSMTVLIDGVPVKSVELDPKKQDAKVKVSLSGEDLAPGFHTIAVSFYGHMSEDMCVNMENTANWLTILSKSSIFLELNEEDIYTNMLETYPYPFIQQTRNEAVQTTVVIPNEPSDETLSAALQMAHALRDKGVTDSIVPIIFEDGIDKINTHIIAIGEENAWESDVSDLMKQASIKSVKDEVSIHTHNIDDGESTRAFLLITGEEKALLAEYVRVLTDSNLTEQLSGDKISLKNVPPIEEKSTLPTTTFKKMGISDMTISGLDRMSQAYFHHVPERMLHDKTAYLQLNLKMAETLRSEEGEQEAELIVMINDVPHSVALDELVKEDEESFYVVDIPVAKKTYQESSYMRIQLIGNGLRQQLICVPDDDNRWIYIDDSSSFSLPNDKMQDVDDFSSWPYPFAQLEELETLLVVPNKLTTDSIESLHNLTTTLSGVSNLEDLNVVSSADVSEDDLAEQHVIFVGNVAEHEVLQSNMDDLLIKQNGDGALDVAAYQFVNETAAFVGWVQPSIWNDEYQMSVFAPVQADDQSVMSTELLTYVQETPLHPYIVVEAKHGEIFSQEKPEHEEAPEEVEDGEEEEQKVISIWYIVIFIAITVFSVLTILYLYIRRKKTAK